MDEEIELLPERGIFWPRKRTLIVGDLHFGKDSAFRQAGIPVPGGATERDLARLDGMLGGKPAPSPQPQRSVAARRLIFLGDFFHSKASRCERTLTALATWRKRHMDLEIILVRGNHDRHAGDPPAEWQFTCVEEPWPCGPFMFSHQGVEPGGLYGMSAHLHPFLTLTETGGASLRAPCFWFNDWGVVLPAFGTFTGGRSIKPRAGDRVFVVGEERVVEVFPPALAK